MKGTRERIAGVADRRALSIRGCHSRAKLKIRKGKIFLKSRSPSVEVTLSIDCAEAENLWPFRK